MNSNLRFLWTGAVLWLSAACAPWPRQAVSTPAAQTVADDDATAVAPAVSSPEADGPEDEPRSAPYLTAESDAQDPEGDEGALEDESDYVEEPAGAEAQRPPHPLDGVPQSEVVRRLREAPGSLGSMSLGRPNSGSLINAERLPEDARWELVDPSHAWGTQETIQYLTQAIERVFEAFPDSPPVFIGHLSAAGGGHLSPHRSHQSGQDVDVGFFYTTKHAWYQRANANNLDLPRTWALVRAFLSETDVRMLFLDHSLQTLLRAYALQIGEDPGWLASVFGGGGHRNPLIRHAPGHATHLHVRFYNPTAEETARRCYSELVASKRVAQPTYYVEHVAKKGDSLISIAKRYGVTVKELQRLNRMRGKVVFAKTRYKVPRRGPAPMPTVSRVPPRRLPPPLRAEQPVPTSRSVPSATRNSTLPLPT